MVIYWSIADNGFIVEVPELPGCMADGKTYTEAVNNAQKVIKEWIETANLLNRPIPLPKNRIAT
jgi:predicted RNase H-like HicB family nuclease